jgi:hypothetical protein
MLSFLSLAFLFAVSAQNGKDCAPGKSQFLFNSAIVTPSTPVSGTNFTVDLSFSVPDGVTINSGTAVYSTTYNFIPLSPTTEDLCKNTVCPIESGPHLQSSTSLFPSGLTGTISIKTQWFDDAKTNLLCYTLTLKV